MSQLVLLCGARCTNKTRYYLLHFSKTHKRISFPKTISLHTLFKRICKSLSSGQNLVIDDDCLKNPETRKSLIQKVKSVVGETCRIMCVEFVTSELLCLYQNEWNVLQSQQYHPIDSMNLDIKFVRPTMEEGFDEIKTVEAKLESLRMEYKNAALFVDCHAVIENGKCKTGTKILFEKWMVNSKRRVILLYNEQRTNCDLEKLKKALLDLDCPFPIYYVCLNDQIDTRNYFFARQGGTIAFCHYIFALSLNDCLYISSPWNNTKEHTQISRTFGLCYCDFKDAVRGELNLVRIDNRRARPPFLKDIQQLKSNADIDQWPLLKKLKSNVAEIVYTGGRCVGMILPAKYVKNFVNNDTPIEDLIQEKQSNEEKYTRSVKKSPQIPEDQIFPAASMSTEELKQYFGESVLSQALECKSSIGNFKVKVLDNNIFKMYSCYVKTSASYKQEVLFKNGTLVKSVCTCSLKKKEKGKCKHVCASVMVYIERPDTKNNVLSNFNVKRNLPAWMKGMKDSPDKTTRDTMPELQNKKKKTPNKQREATLPNPSPVKQEPLEEVISGVKIKQEPVDTEEYKTKALHEGETEMQLQHLLANMSEIKDEEKPSQEVPPKYLNTEEHVFSEDKETKTLINQLLENPEEESSTQSELHSMFFSKKKRKRSPESDINEIFFKKKSKPPVEEDVMNIFFKKK